MIRVPGWARAIAARSPGVETDGDPDNAEPRPALAPRPSGRGTDSGLRSGQPVATAPVWRNFCQRSGSNSSSRFAGWVLIRSSTSRR